MTKNAGIPSQCIANDAPILPCIKSAIERPKPHPGHHFRPVFSNGHNVK